MFVNMRVQLGIYYDLASYVIKTKRSHKRDRVTLIGVVENLFLERTVFVDLPTSINFA